MSAATKPDITRRAVVAAGAVCWRTVEGRTIVLLVHRAARADVSLPKGKLDPGEMPPQAAVREIEEETGIRVALGVPLGTIEYPLGGGREKVVHYWAAEVTDDALAASTFRPNQEIAGLEWLTIDKARKTLTYERDREVLDRFAELVASGNQRTFAIIAVRHAKAVPLGSWDGPDATRPLLHRGIDQASSVAPAIAAYRPARLVSSPAARCLATMEPLAAITGLAVKPVDDIGQDPVEDAEEKVRALVRRRLAKGRTVVLCTHGPVVPDIVAAVAEETATELDHGLRRAARLSTAEFTVLHVSAEHPDAGIVAVETHSPLPG